MATAPTGAKKRKQLPPPTLPESKKPVEEHISAADEVVEKNKSKKKKVGNEIDEIFQVKKAKKSKTPDNNQDVLGSEKKLANGIKEGGNSKKTKNKHKRNKEVALDESAEARGPRRRTAEGLAIYAADEISWGKADAGGTPLCPFDCSCCF